MVAAVGAETALQSAVRASNPGTRTAVVVAAVAVTMVVVVVVVVVVATLLLQLTPRRLQGMAVTRHHPRTHTHLLSSAAVWLLLLQVRHGS
jgi:nitrogen fixation/metabolism regulation signal transduction histidine kinase